MPVEMPYIISRSVDETRRLRNFGEPSKALQLDDLGNSSTAERRLTTEARYGRTQDGDIDE
jgi:hypothetical protein